MAKKVLKFGGTSVGTLERIQHVQREIKDTSGIWYYDKNLLAKSTLDSLFNGNTFAIRCSEIKGLLGWQKNMSDPIFSQVFSVVQLAARQLAENGTFDFPEKGEPALIPLQKPLRSRYKSDGYTLGMAQRLCGETSAYRKKKSK